MKVSILLATYNGEKYLSEQLDSIISQDFSDFKLYVSDDCSNDGTVDILKKYAEKYPEKIILQSISVKYGSAKNNFLHLLNSVDSDVYLFSDQDDVWTVNHISEFLEVYKKIDFNTPTLLHSDLSVVDENLNEISDSFFKYSKMVKVPKSKNFYFLQNNVTGCVMMINNALKKLVLRNTNYLFDNMNKIPMHDQYIALVASKFGKIIFLDKKLEKYRQHGNNVVGANNVLSVKNIIRKFFKIDFDWIASSVRLCNFFLSVFGDLISESERKILCGYGGVFSRNKINILAFLIKEGFSKEPFFRRMRQIFSLLFLKKNNFNME